MIQITAPSVPAFGAPLPLNLPPSPPGTVFDLRGQTFYLHYSANLDPDGPGTPVIPSPLPTGWTTGLKPTNRYPLVNPGDVTATNGTHDAELFGGRIQGDISTTLDGYVNASNGGYPNSAAVDLRTWTSTHHVVRQMRIDRVWDAVRMNKDPGGPATHEVVDCWFSNVRDDVIECDLGYRGLNITNCLFDRVFSVASYAPSGTIADHSSETITYTGNLIRLFGFPYGQLQPDGSRIVKPYHISFFKTSTGAKAKMPKLAMFDNVIAADTYIQNNTANNATGTHWADAFRQIDPARCSGNVFCWFGGDTVPPIMLDQMPAGWGTVLTGEDAAHYWNRRTVEWALEHATNFSGSSLVPARPVERLDGDLPWTIQ